MEDTLNDNIAGRHAVENEIVSFDDASQAGGQIIAATAHTGQSDNILAALL